MTLRGAWQPSKSMQCVYMCCVIGDSTIACGYVYVFDRFRPRLIIVLYVHICMFVLRYVHIAIVIGVNGCCMCMRLLHYYLHLHVSTQS